MSHMANNNDLMIDFLEKSFSSAIFVSSDTSIEDILKIMEEEEHEMKNCNTEVNSENMTK